MCPCEVMHTIWNYLCCTSGIDQLCVSLLFVNIEQCLVSIEFVHCVFLRHLWLSHCTINNHVAQYTWHSVHFIYNFPTEQSTTLPVNVVFHTYIRTYMYSTEGIYECTIVHINARWCRWHKAFCYQLTVWHAVGHHHCSPSLDCDCRTTSENTKQHQRTQNDTQLQRMKLSYLPLHNT